MQIVDVLVDHAPPDGFALGVAMSGLLAVVVGALSLQRRRHRGVRFEPLPLGGGVAVVASLVAIEVAGPLRGALVLGCGVAAIGGLVASGRGRAFGAVAAAPGAAVALWGAAPFGRQWTVGLALVWVVALSPVVASFDQRHRHAGLGPALFAVTAAGAYATVPETGPVAAVLGASVPVALLGWPVALARLGPGSFPLLVVFAAAVVHGSQGRSVATIGGLGCIGVLALDPLFGRSRRSAILRYRDRGSLHLVGVHVVLVGLSSRVVGLRHEFAAAVALGTVVLALGWLLLHGGPRGGEVYGDASKDSEGPT
jgi:hypothetical protein